MKINYLQIESILRKIGYPKNKLNEFRKRYAKIFLLKIGQIIEDQLDNTQRQQIKELLLKNNKNKIKEISQYLESQKLKGYFKKHFQEMENRLNSNILNKMKMYASSQEKMIINQIIQG